MTEAQVFESEKNKKALLYTSIICGIILLLFIIIKWKNDPVEIPIPLDLVEINLGNEQEGLGDVQPLIKGARTPSNDVAVTKQTSASSADDKMDPDDNADKDAAPVSKTKKNDSKVKSVVQVESPIKKQQTAKVVMPGMENGKPGNNPDVDNGFKNFGKNPNGIGDPGNPNGSPNGKIGGIVSTGRPIKSVGNYSFPGDLGKATIWAVIKVSPEGKGTFVKLDGKSTSTDPKYADAIRRCLPTIKFVEGENESLTKVKFNFTINQ